MNVLFSVTTAIVFSLSVNFFGQAAPTQNTPQIAIIIDDIGYRKSDFSVLDLPGQFTFAIVPYAPYTKEIATLAHKSQREVMAHLPMEALTNNNLLGKGALRVSMNEEQTRQQVRNALTDIPYVSGINNHMGSHFTTQPKHLGWLMDELAQKDLFFLDSKTTSDSMAEQVALQHGVPTGHRHVFLDNQLDEVYLNKQFNQLIKIAERYNHAIAIAHPHPQSIAFLQNKIAQLQSMGINLVPVSDLLPEMTRIAQEKQLKYGGGHQQLVGSAEYASDD